MPGKRNRAKHTHVQNEQSVQKSCTNANRHSPGNALPLRINTKYSVPRKNFALVGRTGGHYQDKKIVQDSCNGYCRESLLKARSQALSQFFNDTDFCDRSNICR